MHPFQKVKSWNFKNDAARQFNELSTKIYEIGLRGLQEAQNTAGIPVNRD